VHRKKRRERERERERERKKEGGGRCSLFNKEMEREDMWQE